MAIYDPRDIPDWVRAAFPDDFAKPEPLRGMDTECENISMPGECVCGHTPWCNIHKDTDRPCNCGAGPARRHGKSAAPKPSRTLFVIGSCDQAMRADEANPARSVGRITDWRMAQGLVDFDYVVYPSDGYLDQGHIDNLARFCCHRPGARQISVEEAEGRPGMTPGRICDSDAALGAMLRGTFMEQYLPDRDMLPDGRWVIRRPNGSVEIVDVHHQTVNNLPLTEFLERRGPEPTRTIPRICGWERRDATEPARVHENVHNLGTESGKPPDHRMGWKPGD